MGEVAKVFRKPAFQTYLRSCESVSRRALCDSKREPRSAEVVRKMGSPPHLAQEGMQVYSTPAHEGLQVVEQNPYTYQGQIQPDVVPLHILGAKYGDDNLLPAYPERRICGVRARIFWTIFGVAMFLIVVAAAVGGGIGGSRAAQHAKEATEADLARYVPF